MNDESVIMIPKVQRDYAYGRKENKVEEVLDGMLTTMLDAVANNSVEIFDFVYGGSFVKRNDTGAGLIPLDGQQRLTTLFLLHWYASVVQPVVEDGEVFDFRGMRLDWFRLQVRITLIFIVVLLLNTSVNMRA